jgi:hypothetical protein
VHRERGKVELQDKLFHSSIAINSAFNKKRIEKEAAAEMKMKMPLVEEE